MFLRTLTYLLLGVPLAGGFPVTRGQSPLRQAPAVTCAADSTLNLILGDWTVTDSAGAMPLGTNRVERILGGCAVTETWHDPDGSPVYGIYYYHTSEHRWKLVLVSGGALAPGGVKERHQTAILAGGGFRFLGEVLGIESTVLDRLTFLPTTDGRVREMIERSRDGGGTWRMAFDGYYRRATVALSSDVGTSPAAGSQAADSSSCARDPALHLLDFWVGSWKVVDSAGTQVGTNRIDRILGGCALVENWRDADGTEGKSLFYYVNAQKQWKQVWVTPDAHLPGGMKEKRLVGRLAGGAVRFQGEILSPRGMVLDRTTLTPLSGGRVRQLIEVSRDGGETWIKGFDAIYLPS